MSLSQTIANLFEEEFKEKAKISQISPDLRGKCIVIYGGNNLGKTTQAAKLKNPVFMPFEKGMNGISGALVLQNSNWADVKSNIKKLSKPKFLKALQSGEQISVIWDGVERAGIYCQRYIEQKYDVFDVSEAKGGFGAWSQYEKEYWSEVDKLLGFGYTVVFICHESLNKNKNKMYPKGDNRCIAPVIDNADFVIHLSSNGVDEDGKEILSSGSLVETDEYFARSRFKYVDKYIEEFTAENLEKTIIEGIKKELEIKGETGVNFEEQQEIYKGEEYDFEDLREEIKQLCLKLQELDRLDEYSQIVAKHLGEGALVSEASRKQIEPLICIKNDLEDLIEQE